MSQLAEQHSTDVTVPRRAWGGALAGPGKRPLLDRFPTHSPQKTDELQRVLNYLQEWKLRLSLAG